MPYLEDQDRAAELIHANQADPKTLPELVLVLLDTIDEYVSERGANATALHEALGGLRGAELELARRIVAPYEAIKLAESGAQWVQPESTDPLANTASALGL